jgi:hypothetical protein
VLVGEGGDDFILPEAEDAQIYSSLGGGYGNGQPGGCWGGSEDMCLS